MAQVEKSIVRRATVLAGLALLVEISSLFLPLHFQGFDDPSSFGDAFPSGAPLQLTIRFIITNFLIPSVIGIGIWFLVRRPQVASGIFLAAGIVAILVGVAGFLSFDTGLRSVLLTAIRISVGILLILAARESMPSRSDHPLPSRPD